MSKGGSLSEKLIESSFKGICSFYYIANQALFNLSISLQSFSFCPILCLSLVLWVSRISGAPVQKPKRLGNERHSNSNSIWSLNLKRKRTGKEPTETASHEFWGLFRHSSPNQRKECRGETQTPEDQEKWALSLPCQTRQKRQKWATSKNLGPLAEAVALPLQNQRSVLFQILSN